MSNSQLLVEAPHPELSFVFRSLGQPTEQFEPAKGTLYGWVAVLGLGTLLAAGFTLFILANLVWREAFGRNLIPGDDSDPTWPEVVGGLVTGVVVTALCVVWLRSKLGELAGRVYYCPGGFIVAGRGGPQVFPWDDIVRIHQDPVEPAKAAAPGDPPMKRDTSFLVVRKDGEMYGFWRDSLRGHARFARLLYAQARDRDIPWEFDTPE